MVISISFSLIFSLLVFVALAGDFGQAVLDAPPYIVKPERPLLPAFRLFGQFPRIAAHQFRRLKEPVELQISVLRRLIQMPARIDSNQPAN